METDELFGINGGDVIVESGSDEEESGRRSMIKMNDPKMPSKLEKEEHEKTHLPYRSWCRHCVRGRGKELPHKKTHSESSGVEMSFDFFFLGDEDGAKPMTTLMAIERTTKMKMATPVPSKSTGEFISRRILAFMKEVGCKFGDMIVKSDQEPAILAILEHVARLRAAEGGGKTVPESSPVGDSRGNGLVERAIQSLEAMARVLRSQLEERWGRRIDPRHPVFTWMVGYAAVLLNRFEVGKDGRTAYERLKNKTSKMLGLEFGELILWKRKPVGGAMGKMSCMWEDGVYLGLKSTTGETIVGTTSGVWKTRSVQRRPMDERWKAEALSMIGGVPWRVRDDDPNVDGEKLDCEATEPVVMKQAEENAELGGFLENEQVVRTFGIKGRDFEKHGYTKACPGCLSILRGTTRQKHSTTCRQRMEAAMADDPGVIMAKQRQNEFLEKALEKEDSIIKRRAMDVDKDATHDGAKRAREVSDELGEMNVKKGRHSGISTPALVEEESPSGVKRSRQASVDEAGDIEMPVLEVHLDINQDENDSIFEEWAVDDLTGKELSREAVASARGEEIEFMRQMPVYDEVDVEECFKETGRAPISVRWVDVNKGSDEEPVIRCRLVARDFKLKGDKDRADLFAATPPLEALRMLIRMSRLSHLRKSSRRKWKLMFIDVKKAHLNAKLEDDEHVYVDLPDEAGAAGKCGKLRRWLYGMRPAASSWEREYSERLEAAGYIRGKSAPTTFFNPASRSRCVVHGDDFTFMAEDAELKRMANLMSEWYDIKVRAVLGPEENDDKEVVILGRTVRWKDNRNEYEADAKYARLVWEGMGLKADSQGLDGPILKESSKTVESDDEELNRNEATNFRKIAATANYLSLDRPDIQYATKEICRDMSRPKASSWAKLKRLARYLVKFPRLVLKYFEGDEFEDMCLDVMADSDWAGCLTTRRSTSGGVVSLRGGMLKGWSSTQGSVAMSSGEAEYYATVKAASEALGAQALAADLGWAWKIRLWLDSTAAKSMASRMGLGRVRHLEVRFLWLQEVVRAGRVALRKIAGEQNPADAFTKPKSITDIMAKLGPLNLVIEKRP